ncbi:MAG: AraC family transcriptional regulator [Oscillospiraceae bacterium]|nr:AraC family transcriptional regulator [Oscillospiraceae bacterium]
MDLLTQLNNAVKYIEENICDDIEIEKISGATNYSPYHFGRIFYYITDMPLSEYIRKRKLSLAAMELQNSAIKVIDLAVKFGYDSADSFTRAFIKQHGVTPTEARRSGVVLKLFPPITFQIKIQGVQEMNWRIEEREAFEVFGIERIFKNDESGKIPAFWDECHGNGSYEKLFVDAGSKKDEFGKGACKINALCGHINPAEDSFPYMLFAVRNDECKTDGYTITTVPKTTWAVFRADDVKHIGLQIPKLFHCAYSEWLPSSLYEKVNGPDMEIYGENFEEVWIPVTKK